MTLTIIRGLPGSGKSTYAKKNFNCLILENDMFHMHDGVYDYSKDDMPFAINWCISMCEQALLRNMDVVVCNTFTKRIFVENYKKMAERYGANFSVIRMANDFGNIHNVPLSVLESMKNNFDDYPNEKVISY